MNNSTVISNGSSDKNANGILTASNHRDISNSELKFWKIETIEMLLEQGYRAIPQYIGTSAKYANNQNYQVDAKEWKSSQNDVIGVALDRVVLIDYDGNKPTGAIPLAELQNIIGIDLQPHMVQTNSKGDSLHYLFKLPDDIKPEDIKSSFDGWLHGVDVKTKNQLVHLKFHKTITNSELPMLSELTDLPSVVLNALRVSHPSATWGNRQEWKGDKVEIEECARLLSFIEPDCDYKTWSSIFAAVTSKFGQIEEAYKLLDDWSANGCKYTGSNDVIAKAKSYKQTGNNLITFASLCKTAEDHGANLAQIKSEMKRKISAEKYPNLESCYEVLEVDKSDPEDKSSAFDAACLLIGKLDSGLTKSNEEKKLKELTNVTLSLIRGIAKDAEDDGNDFTHIDMADRWVKTYNKNEIVAEYGKFWTYSEPDGIWTEIDLKAAGIIIAKKFNTEQLCKKGSDYSAISNVAYDIVYEKDFFSKAPKGVNMENGFIRVCEETNKLEVVPASREHRCTFRLPVTPEEMDTPLFDNLLQDAFGDTLEEQRELLLQFLGLSLLGVMPSLQCAVFLYGVGGSGKSTILKVIEALVPSDSRCSVKPEDFGDDYHRAALAGKRFNLVPEIDKDKLLPSADFKAVISGDTVSAREPYGKVFDFTPNTSNWFNGNSFLATRDRSDAFWRRWAIIHFKHAKSKNERVRDLDKLIIKHELSGILLLALTAANNYLSTGKLVESAEHERMILKWQSSANSVLQWLDDADETSIEWGGVLERVVPRTTGSASKPITVKEAYGHYTQYCKDNGRKAFNKSVFTDYVTEAGHSVSKHSGYRCFTGLTFYSRLTNIEKQALNPSNHDYMLQ